MGAWVSGRVRLSRNVSIGVSVPVSASTSPVGALFWVVVAFGAGWFLVRYLGG